MAKTEPRVEVAVSGPASVREVIPEAWVASANAIERHRGEWAAKQSALRATVEKFLGTPACGERPTAGKFAVVSSTDDGDYRRMKVEYDVAGGERVRAWLLVPPIDRRRARKNAAVLCLHGTSVEAKDTQIGLGAKPGRDYARQLAREGFVTLAPDHACSGERLEKGFEPYDSTPFYRQNPDWSMAGKAVWDARVGLDVLSAVDGVDAGRLGVCGHSLGGQGTAFVAAFDERVRAAVCSCGLTVWAGDPMRLNWSRKQWYVYFPKLRAAMEGVEPLPFEYGDFFVLAAPRAVMNVSALLDPGFGNMAAMPEMGRQVHRAYRMAGNPEGFANLILGGGHDVPIYSRTATAGWMRRWLCDEVG